MPHAVQPCGNVHGVVFGIRDAEGRWLMVRRSRHVALPGVVCFPGGGVESGEPQEQACIREAREELAIDIRPVRQVWRHEFPERRLILFGWLAQWTGGEIRPDPLEIEQVLWLDAHEGGARPDGIYTNARFIAALEAQAALSEA